MRLQSRNCIFHYSALCDNCASSETHSFGPLPLQDGQPGTQNEHVVLLKFSHSLRPTQLPQAASTSPSSAPHSSYVKLRLQSIATEPVRSFAPDVPSEKYARRHRIVEPRCGPPAVASWSVAPAVTSLRSPGRFLVWTYFYNLGLRCVIHARGALFTSSG